MEHSEEYYKMKYFKYKAKYQQAKQSGGFGLYRPQWTKKDAQKIAEIKVLMKSIDKLGRAILGDNNNDVFMNRFIAQKEFSSIDDFNKFLQKELNPTGNNKDLHTKTLTKILADANRMCTGILTKDFLQICKDQITNKFE